MALCRAMTKGRWTSTYLQRAWGETIGGITAATAGELAAAGADFVAVSAAVWAHPDGPAAAVRELDRVLAGVA